MTVSIAGVIEELVPGTATFHYRTDGGAYTSVPLASRGAGLFTATLPAMGCGDNPEFYFTAEGTVTGMASLPRTAPTGVYNPAVGVVTTIFSDNFDSDPGWTTEGDWAFGQPTGQGGSDGGPDPTSGFTGDFVYGYNLDGDYPNNMAEMHLTTPPFDFTGINNVSLSFQRWLGVEENSFDHAYVRVSTDGVSWTNVWENGGANIADFDWQPVTIDISDLASNQSNVQIRWTMGTSDNVVVLCGWNIDDVVISAVTCSQPNSN